MNPIILRLEPDARPAYYLALAAKRKVWCINYNKCLDFVVAQLSEQEHRCHGWVCPDNCAYYVEKPLNEAETREEIDRCYDLLAKVVEA